VGGFFIVPGQSMEAMEAGQSPTPLGFASRAGLMPEAEAYQLKPETGS